VIHFDERKENMTIRKIEIALKSRALAKNSEKR